MARTLRDRLRAKLRGKAPASPAAARPAENLSSEILLRIHSCCG
jgi:hypothetical protein